MPSRNGTKAFTMAYDKCLQKFIETNRLGVELACRRQSSTATKIMK